MSLEHKVDPVVEDVGKPTQADIDEKNVHHSELLGDAGVMNHAFDAENAEHNMTAWQVRSVGGQGGCLCALHFSLDVEEIGRWDTHWVLLHLLLWTVLTLFVFQAVQQYPMACFWAFLMCFTIVMESFDMFLNGNFVAQDAFKNHYGVYVEGSGNVIETKWQSALFQSGQCGAFVGVLITGPITNRLGYRWTTILGLVLMNATIFISFFVSRPAALAIASLTFLSRPTRLRFSLSVKLSRAFRGVCSSQTRLPMPPRSFPSSSVVRARLRCR